MADSAAFNSMVSDADWLEEIVKIGREGIVTGYGRGKFAPHLNHFRVRMC